MAYGPTLVEVHERDVAMTMIVLTFSLLFLEMIAFAITIEPLSLFALSFQ